ncbi:hypothetical protein [Micromonospora sp. DT68]|uniref:hypothetical protein n=1 Tax=unclassified Micromonospora TaxID=2617518 RepID=UPI003CFA82EB
MRAVVPGRYGWLLVYGEVVLARAVDAYPDEMAAREAGDRAHRDLRLAVVVDGRR